MKKLIFSLLFLSFCTSHIWAMDASDERKVKLTPSQLEGANCAAMRSVGNHESKKELLERSSPPLKILTAHQKYIHSLVYNPHNPNELASGSADGTVRIWDIVSGQCIKTLPHDGEVISVAYNPDKKNELSSATLTGNLYCWNLETAESNKIKLDGAIHSIVYNPHDSNEIAVGLCQHGYLIYNVKNNKCRRFDKNRRDGSRVVVYNPHNACELITEMPILGGYVTSVTIWDHKNDVRINEKKMCHSNFINTLACDPYNKDQFSSGSSDKTVCIWSREQEKYLQRLPHQKEVRSLAYNPYIKDELASGSFNKVYVWNGKSGQAIWEYELEEGDCVSKVIYNPNRKDELALASGEGLIKIWRLNAMQRWFSSMHHGVLPVKTFMQIDVNGNKREVTVDPKVLLLLMHKLGTAFKNCNEEERKKLTEAQLKILSSDGRTLLTPQELAYLSKVVFESGEDARDAVSNFVAIEKRNVEKKKKKKVIKKIVRKKRVHE